MAEKKVVLDMETTKDPHGAVMREATAKSLCVHINKQFMNMQGQLQDLACELEEGHTGDHQAKYKALREFSGMKNPNSVYQVWMGKEYEVVEEVGMWSDAAGRPAAEISGELTRKREELQRFIDLNPGMTEAHKQKARELGLIPALRA